MRRIRYNFDVSTAAGQMRLMRLAVGQDYEGLGQPIAAQKAPVLPQENLARVPEPGAEFLGRRLKATWKPGRFNAVTVGVVVKTDAVSLSESIRLVVERPDGTTQRCYTKDPDWLIEVTGS